MTEPEGKSITGGPTPEPPLEASDLTRKVKEDTEDEPLPDKAKTAASELDREVSGEYEAKQEREAATDPGQTPPRQASD
jgi:hypothetical protein